MPDESQSARPSTHDQKIKKVDGRRKNGGQPGCGRKAGKQSAKTKARIARAERAIESVGITPLEVMLHCMNSAWVDSQNAEDEDARQKLEAIAVSHAKDAAPYVHPKLQPIDRKTGDSEQQMNIMVTFK